MVSAPAIRVAVLDDEALIAHSIASWLETNDATVEIVVVATRAADIFDRLDDFDVLVLDVGLHPDDPSAAEITDRVTRTGIPCLLASALEDHRVRLALEAGAASYVPKSADPSILLERIHEVAAGTHALTPEMAAILLSQNPAGLSPREVEVLTNYAQGLLTKQVARMLGVKVSTVESHLKRIRRKYDKAGRPAHTRYELQSVAIADGLIEPPTGASEAPGSRSRRGDA